MSKLILFLICYNILSFNLGEYVAPRSAQFPFGDEIFNADIKEDRVQDEAREVNIEIVKDIYTFCLNTTDDDEDQSQEIPYNDNQCSKCDVRPTADKKGVLVECYNCTDASTKITLSQEDSQATHILYLTNFLEIANYSAPEEC